MKTLVLVVMMTVNGEAQGAPVNLIATSESCRTELAMLAGINMATRDIGIERTARCVYVDMPAQ